MGELGVGKDMMVSLERTSKKSIGDISPLEMPERLVTPNIDGAI